MIKATAKRRNGIVAALAGRRIDAKDAKVAQFPLANVPIVKLALAELLRKEHVSLLICSAACGADLLALDAALDANIRCRVVLPFDPKRFRQTSVIDRPGDWGILYERVIRVVKSEGYLIVLSGDTSDELSYHRANEVIVQQALTASKTAPLAILVWEGQPRHKDDATAAFRSLALRAGMLERAVPTLCG